MNRLPAMPLEKIGALVLVAMFFATACATQKIDWAPRVGVYTFDQAVLELGPPDKQAKLQDGTVVAEWLTQRGYRQGHLAPLVYRGGYDPYYDSFPIYTETRTPDYFLRLTFGPDGKLQAWKKFAR